MQITCPKCGRPIPGIDIDLTTRAGVCRPCGEVVAFRLPAAEVVTKLYKPQEMRWSEIGQSGFFSVLIKPVRWPGASLGLVAAFWNIVVWGIAITALLHGQAVVLPFMTLHLLAGLVLAYLTAVGLLNTTRIVIDPKRFAVVKGPIPQRGGLEEQTADIERFGLVEEVRGARWGTMGVSAFSISAQTRDGRACKLRVPFADRAQAEYAATRLTQVVQDVRASEREGTPYRGVRVGTQGDPLAESKADGDGEKSGQVPRRELRG
jgi:hypothetical protein